MELFNQVQRRIPEEIKSKAPDNISFAEVIADATILVKMGDTRMVLLGHNVINILTTSDPLFCEHTHTMLNNLIRNSTLISVVGEKVRNRFFHNPTQKD